MNTPFNLSTNNDIVGGNSGSPLINAKGEIVGLLFDGNIHSISGAYWFDTEKNRAVAVHPAIMREALSKVYGADCAAGRAARSSRQGTVPVSLGKRECLRLQARPLLLGNGDCPHYSRADLEADAHLVEHDQRAHGDAERLEPQLRLLERKFAAAR